MKKTKIVCTIGPSSLSTEVLERMYQAGMNGARINTAYGDLDQYKRIVESIREIADIPVIVDIKGPEIRLHVDHKRTLSKGEIVKVGFKGEELRFNHNFIEKVDVGDYIYIDNGKIKTRIISKDNKTLSLLVINGGEIDDGKGVNIPNKQLSVPSLSKSDLKVIRFSEEYEVEYIALSFTRNAKDVDNLRSEASSFKGGIIAKIENFEGVKNFKEIMNAVECIMIARGDLGVEIDLEKVPLVQKSIIKICNQEGKPVITATDMLESMIHEPIPTRAEVSDVANAILDGTDAVMLSGETSIGKYPVEAVSIMSRIAEEAERTVKSSVEKGGFINISDAISKAIHNICLNMPVDKVVTLTRSGYTARMIARFRIKQPIIAVTPEENIKRQLELVFGVYPVHIDYRKEKDRILTVAEKLRSMKLISDDETVLFTAAFRTTKKHASNLIEIHNVKELINFGRQKSSRRLNPTSQ